MTRFVERSQLPNAALHILLGETYREILDRPLRRLGLIPLYVPENPCVDPRLRGHADLSLVHLGQNRSLLAPYLRETAFADSLRALGAELCFAEIRQGREYPADAQLNICIWGRRWIGNENTAAEELNVCCAQSEGAMWIPVKQGYANCACCIVSDNAMISADTGILHALAGSGLDLLSVQPGHIELPGFPYGFLGGSAFKPRADLLAFTGHLHEHPDEKAILHFLKQRKVEALFLTDQPAFDVGGLIPITEKS